MLPIQEGLLRLPLATLCRSASDCKVVQADEKREIAKRSSAFWECVDRAPDEFGGYIYKFRAKDEYDDLSPHENQLARRHAAYEMRKKIAPTGEYLASELHLFNPEYRHAAVLHELGYASYFQADGVYLYLPDREAVTARWQVLRRQHPELPELRILSHPGAAADKTFIEAFFTHDVLLSTEKEFVHDHFSHLIRTVIMMLTSGEEDNPTYCEEKCRLLKLVSKGYKQILKAEKEAVGKVARAALTAATSSLAKQVDFMWAWTSYESSQDIYPDDSKELMPVWKEIDELSQILSKTQIKPLESL